MKQILALLTLLALTGCATWSQMDQGLASLRGKPLDRAIKVLGYPSGEQNIAGKRLIVWARNATQTMYHPQTATTYGNVYSGGVMGTYSQTTTYGTYVPVTYACNITLEVDSSDTIVAYQYQGNIGGCAPYIRSLEKSKDFIRWGF